MTRRDATGAGPDFVLFVGGAEGPWQLVAKDRSDADLSWTRDVKLLRVLHFHGLFGNKLQSTGSTLHTTQLLFLSKQSRSMTPGV